MSTASIHIFMLLKTLYINNKGCLPS